MHQLLGLIAPLVDQLQVVVAPAGPVRTHASPELGRQQLGDVQGVERGRGRGLDVGRGGSGDGPCGAQETGSQAHRVGRRGTKPRPKGKVRLDGGMKAREASGMKRHL